MRNVISLVWYPHVGLVLLLFLSVLAHIILLAPRLGAALPPLVSRLLLLEETHALLAAVLRELGKLAVLARVLEQPNEATVLLAQVLCLETHSALRVLFEEQFLHLVLNLGELRVELLQLVVALLELALQSLVLRLQLVLRLVQDAHRVLLDLQLRVKPPQLLLPVDQLVLEVLVLHLGALGEISVRCVELVHFQRHLLYVGSLRVRL